MILDFKSSTDSDGDKNPTSIDFSLLESLSPTLLSRVVMSMMPIPLVGMYLASVLLEEAENSLSLEDSRPSGFVLKNIEASSALSRINK